MIHKTIWMCDECGSTETTKGHFGVPSGWLIKLDVFENNKHYCPKCFPDDWVSKEYYRVRGTNEKN